MKYIFEQSKRGPLSLQIQTDDGQILKDVARVLRMREACRALRRSRRHLYRYVERGWLSPAAKFSGEYFFDWEDLKKLAHRRGPRERRRSIPARMAPLFPEYTLPALEPERDADTILSRILECGTSRDIRWAVRRYALARRRRFLSAHGRRLLSERAFHFWSWLWGGVRQTAPFWRDAGRSWGGVS
jgi:hypothetical protein